MDEKKKVKPKVLLFCDNPACFAAHLAKKNYGKIAETTGESK